MAVAGIKDEETKANIFKMRAGSKLLDILDNTPVKDGPDVLMQPYTNALNRLRQYFGSRDYVLLQRQKLRAMPQGPEEPDMKYVHRVSAVAKLCGYMDDQLIEIVADVLQSHAANRRIREAARKAARKGDSLQELIDRVRVSDFEKQAEDIYVMHHPPEDCRRVFAVARGPPRSSSRNDNFRRREHFNRNGRDGRTSTPCWRCTGVSHRAEDCYAIDKFCHLCRAKGHIQRA
uniref:CCHC-type domain-containing protein n=1 Tax=Anopheles atroparvus TaxID=41427 RepID=A0A182J0X3_ANOAO